MYERQISHHVRSVEKKYRVLSFLGPRQSGKTTLCKSLYPDFEYRLLESPDTREFAMRDPKGFLNGIRGNVIIDEVQRVPELLSYLQGIIDDSKDRRRFVLTGSNSLSLLDQISQSLAGRVHLLNILPLVRSELPEQERPKTIDEALWSGLYPKVFAERLNPKEWFNDYYQTYVEKDVRQLLQVENLDQFDRFIRICAGRIGQLASFASLATDVGIKQPTAIRWFSVLQASYIAFTLQPHFRNFNKRVVKAPKIYFYDTGLLCYLLRIQEPSHLQSHPLRGFIFENWVIAEVMKAFYNVGSQPPTYFWRDQHGHEVDLVLDRGKFLELCEIKVGETFQDEYLDSMRWLNALQKNTGGHLIYGGQEDRQYRGFALHGWTSAFAAGFSK